MGHPPRALRRPVSLRLLLIATFLGLAVGLTSALSVTISSAATRSLKLDIQRDLARIADQIMGQVDRVIFERYQDILQLARLATTHPEQRDAVGDAIAQLQNAHPEYAWAGVIDASGHVVVGTDGVLVGVDASRSRMYRYSREHPYIGDVYPAPKFSSLLGQPAEAPLRLIDIAAPIIGPDGEYAGSVVARLNWTLMSSARDSVLTGRQDGSGIDVLIIDRLGAVLAGPTALIGKRLSVGPSAESGATDSVRSVDYGDGDGDGTYITVASESAGYREFSGLGWQVLVRQNRNDAFAPVANLRHRIWSIGLALCAFCAGLGFLAAQRISRPLHAITRAAERLQERDEHAVIPIRSDYKEVAVLSETMSNLFADLNAQRTALLYQATHDALTGTANRRGAAEFLRSQIDRGPSNPVAVFFIDLDRFKRFNDGLGHEVGDQLLAAVANRLTGATSATNIVGRQGGDEFVMIVTIPDDAVPELANHLLRVLDPPFLLSGRELHAEASIGIACFPRDGSTPEELLKNAGRAMGTAKRAGRNRWARYSAEMDETGRERLALETELRHAIERGQLRLVYQPQINLKSGAMVGVEALLRWTHPEQGEIARSEFIAIAEQSRLIVPIGLWVLDQACRQVRAWMDAGLEAVPVAVNLSTVQFQQPDLVQQIAEVLKRTGVPARLLNLEITESLLMNDIEQAIRTMSEIRALGVRLAIDDFGTGFSSLSYLKRFPVSQIKIDRSFIRDISHDANDAAIVQAVLGIAQSLRLDVIAEGVEDEFQWAYLVAHGCKAAQGYLFGRPVPADELTSRFRPAAGAVAHGALATETV